MSTFPVCCVFTLSVFSVVSDEFCSPAPAFWPVSASVSRPVFVFRIISFSDCAKTGSWLTTASLTPSIASRVFFTLASQCPHIIPSIFIVFVMVDSSCFFLLSFLCFIFLSLLASYILKRFSLSAFVTTQKLDKLMAAAPNIGFSFSPNNGYQIPAANGIPMTL